MRGWKKINNLWAQISSRISTPYHYLKWDLKATINKPHLKANQDQNSHEQRIHNIVSLSLSFHSWRKEKRWNNSKDPFTLLENFGTLNKLSPQTLSSSKVWPFPLPQPSDLRKDRRAENECIYKFFYQDVIFFSAFVLRAAATTFCCCCCWWWWWWCLPFLFLPISFFRLRTDKDLKKKKEEGEEVEEEEEEKKSDDYDVTTGLSYCWPCQNS